MPQMGEESVKSLSAPSALRRRGGRGGDHRHDGGHIMKLGKKLQWLSDIDYDKKRRRAKLGRQYAFFTSCKSSTINGGGLAAPVVFPTPILFQVRRR